MRKFDLHASHNDLYFRIEGLLLKSQPMLLLKEKESVRSETDCAPSSSCFLCPLFSADFCKMYLQLIDCTPRAAAYSRAA